MAPTKKSRARRNRPGNRSNGIIPHPPQLTVGIRGRTTVRFQAVAAGTDKMQFVDLGDLFCVAATTTSAYQLMRAIKIERIEMWAPPTSSLAPVTVAITPTASSLNPGSSFREVSDTSMGSSEPAHVVWTPSRQSTLSMWQDSTGTADILEFTYPAATIIDVTYSYTLRGGGNAADIAVVDPATAVTGAVAGATVGRTYCRALTSASTSTTNLAPVSYETI